jgi:hypothetical protein
MSRKAETVKKKTDPQISPISQISLSGCHLPPNWSCIKAPFWLKLSQNKKLID